MEKTKHTHLASLAYLAFIIPLFSKEKNDEFVKYHTKQAIVLVLVTLMVQGVIAILGWWSRWLWVLFPLVILLVWALRAFYIGLAVLGFLNAEAGEKKPLPWIGKHAEHFN